jgi:hypothetical protein
MINLQIHIDNPFPIPDWKQRDYLVWERRVKWAKHKAFAFQLSSWRPAKLFSLIVSTRISGDDHAGPQLSLEVCGLFLNLHLYDTRHWDYAKNCWHDPGVWTQEDLDQAAKDADELIKALDFK